MNRFSSGNSIIPTEAEHDRHYAIRCEECQTELTSHEIRKGEPFLCEDHEHLFDEKEKEE